MSKIDQAIEELVADTENINFNITLEEFIKKAIIIYQKFGYPPPDTETVEFIKIFYSIIKTLKEIRKEYSISIQ